VEARLHNLRQKESYRFRASLAELRGYPGLWNPTAAECARYWLEAYPASAHLRLAPSIWQDYPGSLS